MVATILLVAITVVLAAVLYFVVSQLTHTVSSASLGSQFAWGAPTNATGTSLSGCPNLFHYCYHIDIAWTGGSVGISNFQITLQSSVGTPVAWPASITSAGGTVLLTSPTTGAVVANYWAANLTWQPIPPYAGTLAPGYALVIYCGGAAEGSGAGLQSLALVAVGTNGYAGTVPSTTFS